MKEFRISLAFVSYQEYLIEAETDEQAYQAACKKYEEGDSGYQSLDLIRLPTSDSTEYLTETQETDCEAT